MATIKAPFNFVPLSDQVYFPDWANQISHDIPFADGESGVIELKITAETPIFVRNGHTRQQDDSQDDEYKSFSKVNEQYFIPATSIKGSVRNVLEIISFSKMDQIANQRYSLRDLQLKKEYLSFFQNSDVHCGWLHKVNESEFEISDNGIPKRISHTDLDALWDTNFDETFKDGSLLKTDANRNALYKINLSKGKQKAIRYDEFAMNSVNSVDKRIIANYKPDGKFAGTIVLTGQPSARKDRVKNSDGTIISKGKGKCYEFVFPETELNEFRIPARSEMFLDFSFIYKDSEDWKYWRNELKKGKSIPVFFSLKDGVISHFGLSYLYKLPYKNRVKDCLPENHKKSTQLDLSECLFGTTDAKSKESLKGRIQFSHAFLEKGEISQIERSPYMASPKSSYYPMYLQQKGVNGQMDADFLTFMSDKAKLKGWKRYPVHETIAEFSIPDKMKAENLSPFYPVNKGGLFNCKIRFHNLKKDEIGAILNAIMFNKRGFHSIGFAKPYGYGQVKIEVANHSVLKYSIEEYINSFIKLMSNEISNYEKTPQLNELKLMSVPQDLNTRLEYMDLKEFVDCKKQNVKKEIPGEYLPFYSEMIKKPEPVKEVVLVEEALVMLASSVLQARLIAGKDTKSKPLLMPMGINRPKKGDSIMVKIIKKGGNINKLEFISKL